MGSLVSIQDFPSRFSEKPQDSAEQHAQRSCGHSPIHTHLSSFVKTFMPKVQLAMFPTDTEERANFVNDTANRVS